MYAETRRHKTIQELEPFDHPLPAMFKILSAELILAQ